MKNVPKVEKLHGAGKLHEHAIMIAIYGFGRINRKCDADVSRVEWRLHALKGHQLTVVKQ